MGKTEAEVAEEARVQSEDENGWRSWDLEYCE
jgi:hypothetical protein